MLKCIDLGQVFLLRVMNCMYTWQHRDLETIRIVSPEILFVSSCATFKSNFAFDKKPVWSSFLLTPLVHIGPEFLCFCFWKLALYFPNSESVHICYLMLLGCGWGEDVDCSKCLSSNCDFHPWASLPELWALFMRLTFQKSNGSLLGAGCMCVGRHACGG